ncbi:unnamed protein product [Cyclocybe aegerita]|uniref:Uncharacterized protein n=1 Tax=Cyclocybe aegerita TaxID=1973307 RepID=A0A8S0W4L6_CYCAE|nr:unnamed protein product [Cyclocybe aegerita]
MFFELNVPVQKQSSKKGKHSQQEAFSTVEMNSMESRVDLLNLTEKIEVGYTVIAFSQTVPKRVDPKTHVNVLDSLFARLRPRAGVLYLKRLNIVLDQDSEKGFGLINANVPLFNSYDLLALVPTTQTTFSLACLTHSLPSQLTAHVISLPLTLPRLPYHLKHTLVRTAIKNGCVFEINYVGALGGEQDATLVDANAAESGPSAKRNWWAAMRELVRVTKGKGLIISGGVVVEADIRPPRDVANLIAISGLAQDAAHDASTKSPKSLVARAQTRKTYRAVLSEPKVVFPEDWVASHSTAAETSQNSELNNPAQKRPRQDSEPSQVAAPLAGTSSKKKKRKHNQQANA